MADTFWAKVILDLLIAAAYLSVPFAVIRYAKARRGFSSRRLVYAWAFVMTLAGVARLMNLSTLWWPNEMISILTRTCTAAVSVGTAIVIWPLLNQARKLPSAMELMRLNVRLQRSIEQLQQDIADLKMKLLESPARLTGQLLAFSRVQNLNLKHIRVDKLLTNMQRDILSTLGPDISLELDLSSIKGKQVTILNDVTQLELGILNLLANAKDAMPFGGIARIVVNLIDFEGADELLPGRYMALSIIDTGTGMTEEVMIKAGQPFFTTKPHGTGLGLSMAIGLAKQSGGKLQIESQVGKGSSITLLLPIVPESYEVAPTSYSGLKILVVDDDPDLRLIITVMLEELDYEVVTAESGKEALHRLNEEKFSLVILDHAMPEMTGAEVAQKMRSNGDATPIVFITGFLDSRAIQDAIKESAVLSKPFTAPDLISVIQDKLGNRVPIPEPL